MGTPTSTDGSGPSGNPWVIVFALSLFVIDVPMIGVLFHTASAYATVGVAAIVNFGATEAVCRIVGRPGSGLAATLLKLARLLLATPLGGESGDVPGTSV